MRKIESMISQWAYEQWVMLSAVTSSIMNIVIVTYWFMDPSVEMKQAIPTKCSFCFCVILLEEKTLPSSSVQLRLIAQWMKCTIVNSLLESTDL